MDLFDYISLQQINSFAKLMNNKSQTKECALLEWNRNCKTNSDFVFYAFFKN